MRLGQMARKLGISQAEIVRYLSGQNMNIAEGSNVKLEEQHVRLLYARFAPSLNVDTSPAEWETGPSVSESIPDGISDSNMALASEQPAHAPDGESPESSVSPSLAETVIDPAPTVSLQAESSDTIRAPKIELAGLKVIGKIDLPGPRKKDTESKEMGASDDATAMAGENAVQPGPDQKIVSERGDEGSKLRDENSRERVHRDEGRAQDERRRRGKPQREQRSRKNPIAAQRERELEAERERRKEKAAQDKERRTENYLKRVKHSPPTKAMRMFEEPVELLDTASLSKKPSTWFDKLVKWLRG